MVPPRVICPTCEHSTAFDAGLCPSCGELLPIQAVREARAHYETLVAEVEESIGHPVTS